eukprot:jgi/Bigna1/138065/aug1.42_g12773
MFLRGIIKRGVPVGAGLSAATCLGLGYCYRNSAVGAIVHAEEESDCKELLRGAVDKDDLDLVQVQVLFRHGARSNLWDYPGSEGTIWNQCGRKQILQPFPIMVQKEGGGPAPLLSKVVQRQVDTVYQGGCHAGQLTDLGKLQSAALGVKLGSRYPSIVAAISSDPSGIYVRSTNYPRTIETAQYVLRGLANDNWRQTITINTVPSAEELMVGTNKKACPNLGEKFKEGREYYARNTPAQALKLRYQLQDSLSSAACSTLSVGNSKDDWKGNNLIPTNDALKCLSAHGMPLPSWADHQLAKDAHSCAGTQIAYLMQKDGKDSSFRTEVSRLGIGRFLALISSSMEDFITCKPESKTMKLYSGHDTTVLPVLISYQLFNGTWPSFCSSIVWELHRHKTTGNHYVRVLYDFKPMSLLPVTTSGIAQTGSSAFVPFDKFKALTNSLSPTDFESECSVCCKPHVKEGESVVRQKDIDPGKF